MPVLRPLSPVPEPVTDLRRNANLLPAETEHEDFAYAAQALVAGYRSHGYVAASIDPLATLPVYAMRAAELDPRRYGLLLDDAVRLPVEIGDRPESRTLSEHPSKP